MADSLAAANAAFYAALNANLAGDTAPMRAIWSQATDVTNMGPFGGRQAGAQAVAAHFDDEARAGMTGTVVLDDALMVDLGDGGYVTGIERGVDFHDASGAAMRIQHRTTNVFRREADGWRMVHHHCDQHAGG
jgi:ketosteroid isomerase-like protein